MQTVNFSVRIVCDEEGVNPLHLCEQIQEYLDSNHHLYDEDSDEFVPAKVVGYRLEVDNIVPFISQEEY